MESIEDKGKHDVSSSSATAVGETSDPTTNDQTMAEEDNEESGNSLGQQSRPDSTECSSRKTSDVGSNDRVR